MNVWFHVYDESLLNKTFLWTYHQQEALSYYYLHGSSILIQNHSFRNRDKRVNICYLLKSKDPQNDHSFSLKLFLRQLYLYFCVSTGLLLIFDSYLRVLYTIWGEFNPSLPILSFNWYLVRYSALATYCDHNSGHIYIRPLNSGPKSLVKMDHWSGTSSPSLGGVVGNEN